MFWSTDWAWGLPLLVLTVVAHVFVIVQLAEAIVSLAPLRNGRLQRVRFSAAVAITALGAACLHGIEATLWAGVYVGVGAMPDMHDAMLYSLGAISGIKAAFQSLARGEISDLTTLIYDAREQVFDRVNREAAALGAEEVVGIKTYIVELGSGLVEIFAVGTAIRKLPGLTVKTPTLPAQAIIRDRDTWLNGDSGFEIQTLRAGG